MVSRRSRPRWRRSSDSSRTRSAPASMWGFRSDIRAGAPVFDACPIYSAFRRTDLRSTTSRQGRRDSPQMHRKLGRTVAAAVITMIASAAFASTADAALLTASADSCDDGPITQPFQRFGDSANYKLLSGGSFEAGTPAWQLSG